MFKFKLRTKPAECLKLQRKTTINFFLHSLEKWAGLILKLWTYVQLFSVLVNLMDLVTLVRTIHKMKWNGDGTSNSFGCRLFCERFWYSISKEEPLICACVFCFHYTRNYLFSPLIYRITLLSRTRDWLFFKADSVRTTLLWINFILSHSF